MNEHWVLFFRGRVGCTINSHYFQLQFASFLTDWSLRRGPHELKIDVHRQSGIKVANGNKERDC